MDSFPEKVKTLIERIGFNEPAVDVDAENRKIAIFVNEGPWLAEQLPRLVHDLDHVVRLIAKREQAESYFVDINNYRRERERIITEFAKAAARKAVAGKEAVKLPAMNAYERRLVHVELAMHPEVKTESEGEGRDRCVVVKPI